MKQAMQTIKVSSLRSLLELLETQSIEDRYTNDIYTSVCYYYLTSNLDFWAKAHESTSLLDDHRELEPPDPIPNSDVKRFLADGSLGFPHVRVGHRQAFI